jgi:hypothetical protein
MSEKNGIIYTSLGGHIYIGLDDGFITPFIVPSLAECEGAEFQAYPVPNLAFLSEYGFSVQFKIKPKEWEKDKILRIVYPQAKNRSNWIELVVHFVPIMDYIKKEALAKYGYDVGDLIFPSLIN